jgi:hypothetical protein
MMPNREALLGMLRIALCFLILSAFAWADERADRNAIQAVVEALNTNEKMATPSLFTADADSQLARLSDLDRMLLPANSPWSEVTKPRIMLQGTRFISPDVALVDAANTQFGSTILVRRVPILLVMRRVAMGWQIASLRVMVNLIDLPVSQ